MAVIFANHAFDILDVNFSRMFAGRLGWDFRDDADVRYRGATYDDGYLTEWRFAGNRFGSLFMGEDMAATSAGRLTGGTVQAYSELLWTGSRYYELWGMTGASISATDLYAAMRSSSTADDDRLITQALSGNDRFNLSPDADIAHGFGGNDTLYGGGGDDVLAGGAGRDELYGQGGNDYLFLDPGNDLLVGGAGRDTVYALGSTDVTIRLAFGGGQDTGFGRDTIRGVENAAGANGDDRLTGDGGANILAGGRGNDVLDGRGGSDVLRGDAGRDRLIGGGGRDELTGGAGADTFVFRSIAEIGNSVATSDVITDFQPGVDRIDLRAIDASTELAGNNAFLWLGNAAIGTSPRGEVRFVQLDRAGTANDVTLIRIDVDSDSAAEAEIRLRGLHDLTAGDLLF